MAPAEQEQGRAEGDDLEEGEDRRAPAPEQQVRDPEDDGDRHEHERDGNRGPLSDAEVGLVAGFRTEIEDPRRVHGADRVRARRAGR